jgi:hypothetical protein
VDHISKANSWNVREVGTFFDTYINLGQLSQYNFKNLYACMYIVTFPELSIEKFMPF